MRSRGSLVLKNVGAVRTHLGARSLEHVYNRLVSNRSSTAASRGHPPEVLDGPDAMMCR